MRIDLALFIGGVLAGGGFGLGAGLGYGVMMLIGGIWP